MYQAYGNTKLARLLLWLAAYVNGFVLFMSLCFSASGLANLLWVVLVLAVYDVAAGWYMVKQGLLYELLLERTWKQVCAGIKFTREGRSFRNGLIGAYKNGDTKTVYPLLREVRGDGENWTALITPFPGQTVAEYSKQVDAFALAFQVPFVSFELAERGLIRMRCGPVQVPETFNYPAQVAGSVPSAHGRLLPDAHDTLKAVPMARDINGQVWHMPIEGQHLLVAGRTGAGKGSWVWSLVFGLEQARKAGYVRLWGCDPKRVELAIGRDWWDEYADTIEGIVELLEKAVADMFERTMQIQGKARKFTPSPETPLNVIIIDELGYVSAMVTDKKLRDRAEKAIATILALGRAVGYSLVGAAQDPRKETVGFRDLFPFRVALGLPAPMVDLVLGDGMHEAGALCEQIPLGESGAGCGYVISEDTAKPLLVRAAWCSDEAIKGKLGAPVDAQVETAGAGYPEYEQGYGPQLDWNGQSLTDDEPPAQWQYREA